MTPVTPVPDHYGPPLHKVLDIKMGFADDDAGVAWVTIDPAKHYGNRWAHGGIAATLADVATGLAISKQIGNPEERIDGTIELKINFLRKVVSGDLTATARMLHLGKRVAVAEVDITNGEQLVAKALATFMLKPPND